MVQPIVVRPGAMTSARPRRSTAGTSPAPPVGEPQTPVAPNTRIRPSRGRRRADAGICVTATAPAKDQPVGVRPATTAFHDGVQAVATRHAVPAVKAHLATLAMTVRNVVSVALYRWSTSESKPHATFGRWVSRF